MDVEKFYLFQLSKLIANGNKDKVPNCSTMQSVLFSLQFEIAESKSRSSNLPIHFYTICYKNFQSFEFKCLKFSDNKTENPFSLKMKNEND